MVKDFRRQELTGKRFARLLVGEFSHKNKYGALYWHCTCDCGNERIVAAGNLRSGTSNSCGCWQREYSSRVNSTHGLDNTPIRHSYNAMRARCYNPNNIGWAYYGGRGVTVCKRWLDSFENFLEDMQSTWREGLSIEREDVNGNYSPENCCWATDKEQSRNRQRGVVVDTPDGPKNLAQMAEESELSYSILFHRFKRGWPFSALFLPKGSRRPKG